MPEVLRAGSENRKGVVRLVGGGGMTNAGSVVWASGDVVEDVDVLDAVANEGDKLKTNGLMAWF